jgi:maltose alpha-D-glucosyltransferase/alpha-amylase
MKRLIALRKRFVAFGRGTCEFLLPSNRRLLAFVRRHGDEVLLIVANLSRFVQYTELDLSDYRGKAPVELFGNTEFPTISDTPYFLSLGPHAFLWFSLQEPRRSAAQLESGTKRPQFRVSGDWTAVVTVETHKEKLESQLPSYLSPRRWFRSKASTIDGAEIVDSIVLQTKKTTSGLLCLVKVTYTDRDAEIYVLPLGFVSDDPATFADKWPHAVIAQLSVERKNGIETGLLCDAAYREDFASALLDLVERQREVDSLSGGGTVRGWRTRSNGQRSKTRASRVGSSEQSNTSIVFGEHAIFKLYRRVEEGTNPDVELGRQLTARGFAHTAPLLGALEYRAGKRESMTVASLQTFVPNQGDAWQYTLDELERFFDRAASARGALNAADASPPTFAEGERELPGVVVDTIGAAVAGNTVRQLIDNLEEIYPGIKHELYYEEEDLLMPGISVIVDGEPSQLGLLEHVRENSEVHFLPALGGGM